MLILIFTPNFRGHNKVNGAKIDLDPFPFDLNAWVKERHDNWIPWTS
jgi:hypothetical protein